MASQSEILNERPTTIRNTLIIILFSSHTPRIWMILCAAAVVYNLKIEIYRDKMK